MLGQGVLAARALIAVREWRVLLAVRGPQPVRAERLRSRLPGRAASGSLTVRASVRAGKSQQA